MTIFKGIEEIEKPMKKNIQFLEMDNLLIPNLAILKSEISFKLAPTKEFQQILSYCGLKMLMAKSLLEQIN